MVDGYRNFFFVAIALIFMAGALYIFPGFDFVFVGVLFFSSASSFYLIYEIFKNLKKIGFGHIFAAAIGLAYCFGALNTIVSLYFMNIDVYSYFQINPESMSLVLAVVLISMASLLVFEHLYASPIFDWIPDEYGVLPSDLILPIVVVVMLLISYALGHLGHQGVSVSDEGTVSPFAATTISLSIPAAAFSMYCAINAKGKLRIAFLVLMAFVVLMLVPQGRRVLIYCSLILVISAFLAGAKIDIKSPKIQGQLFLLVVFLYFASKFFWCMRIAKWSMGETTPVWELMQEAVAIMLDSSSYNIDDQVSENAALRTFILEYLAMLYDKAGDIVGMHGDVLMFNFRLAVPSIFDSQKWEVLQTPAEEDIVHPHLNLPSWDAANSVYTTGISDFYLLGMLLYPFLILVLFRILMYFVRKTAPWMVVFVISFVLINELLNVETVLSSYFVVIRNSALLLIFLQVYSKVRETFFMRD